MITEYTQKQIEKARENLPEELLEALFSVETSDSLWETTKRHDLMDERGSKISTYVGYVLMGLILPQEFSLLLEKELKLSKKKASEVTREINRLIFYPVKPALEQIQRMEVEVTAKIVTPKIKEGGRSEPPKESAAEDRYRESLE